MVVLVVLLHLYFVCSQLYDFELAIMPDVVVIEIDCWRSVGLPLVVGTRLGSYGYAHSNDMQ